MKSIVIYTDGACKGNPGRGGWSYVVAIENESVKVDNLDLKTENEAINMSINRWKSNRVGTECPMVLSVSFGGSSDTTNNRMEMTAILEALRYFDKNGIDKPIIYSDSAYCVNALSLGWIENWVKNGWKTSSGSNVKNDDLLKQIWELCKDKEIQVSHVRGHSGNVLNDLADNIADKASSFY